MKKELADKKDFISKLEDGTIKKIPDDIMSKAEKEYDTKKTYFKKVKKACNNIIEAFSDMTEMKKNDFIESLGIELDMELMEKLKNKIL